MARLAILVSASSIFLVATWLLVMANHNHEYVHRLDGPPNFTRDIDHGSPPPDGVLPPDAVKAVEATKLEIQQDLQAKRKRTVKGVTVDRKAVIEDVSLDDLRAPEGRMWIPAAIIGPLNPKALDPFFHVLVAYCQLDMAAYHETPWLFAMGTFHQRHSGCLTDPNLVKTYRLSSLAAIVDEHPDDFVNPTGFIYHETRCGSTLTANMLAAVPSNIVHSETPPPVAAINLCAGKCSEEMRNRLIRTVFRLMGPAQQGHTHLFFKFQSSKFVTDVEKAWPDVKWVYLFRDPLEVMASNLKGAWRKTTPKRVHNSTEGHEQEYNMGGPCVRAIAKHKRGASKSRRASPKALVNECSKQLESLNEIALNQIKDGSPNGIVVEYRQLPEAISEYVYPEHFEMASTEEGREEFKAWMEPITHMYSKGMATVQESAVSKEYAQGMDLAVKEEGSDDAMREAARGMCDTYRTLVAMQRWHKEAEGDTMGTCAR